MKCGKPKILICDDSKNIRKLVRVVLGEKDYDFIEAGDAISAIEKARVEQPNVVVLDIVIPGGRNGLEVCQKLKSDPITSNARIIILTTEATFDTRELAHKAGADVFMTKPFEPKDLKSAVRELLSGRLDACMEAIERIWAKVYCPN